MKPNLLVLAILTLAIPAFAASPGPQTLAKNVPESVKKSGLEMIHAKAPLSFEAKRGQGDRFISRGNGFSISLAPAEASLVLRNQGPPTETQPNPTTVRMRLVGANADAKAKATDPLPGKVNYFIGSDPKQWRTKVATFATVKFDGVYPGVDLVYYGNGRQLEFDFIVAPGADPRQIRLAFEGADKLEIAANGDLVLSLGDGELRQHKPVIYQTVAGQRKEVAGGFRLTEKHEARFEIVDYDRARPLVIDPMLAYSTYLGGTLTDLGAGIAVDSLGYVYIVGGTSSYDFPVVNPFQPGNRSHSGEGGDADAFVTKFAPDGSVVYSTYFGGAGGYFEGGFAIAADQSGNAYIAGSACRDFFGTAAFPTYPAPQSLQGITDAFIAKFNSAGDLVYSKLIGGGDHEVALGIAVDGSGSAFICGWTASADFPTSAGAAQSSFGGFGALGAINGIGDGFVAKLNPSGTAFEYSTFLGGEDVDVAQGIAVDATGNAFVTGQTVSQHFPTTPGAFQLQHGGEEDFFVTKLNSSGTAWVYSTYLGGSSRDFTAGLHGSPRGIAIDSLGNAYTAGATTSDDYPTTPDAIQRERRGAPSLCVTKLNPSGSALVYSTYLGCNNGSYAHGIAVDSTGQAYVCGRTSARFPILNAIYPNYGSDDGLSVNGYLARISADGSQLVYSTYLATIEGNDNLVAHGVAVDAHGTAYVTGHVSFPDFVTTPDAFQTVFGGASPRDPTYGDAFVAIIHSAENELAAPTPTISCPADVVVSAPAGQCSAIVNYSVSASSPNTPCVEVISTPPSGSAFPIGSTTVHCLAKDAVGASATCTFTVTVNDTQRPVIACPANLTLNAPCGQSSAVVHYPTPSATDTCSDVSVTCTPASGAEFPVGVTRVNCVARDAAGNAASCRFTITVNTLSFDFTGFLPPLGGADTSGGSFDDPLQTFKLKSTIPVKFKATCAGAPVLSGDHILQVSKYSDQTTGDTPIDATPTEAATIGNLFRLTGEEWHFNLDTKATGMSAGIWLLHATLSDGSQHSAWIQIK